MNFQPIAFNKEEALKAGGTGGAFIEGNTEQLVKITRAEFVQSKKSGTTGIEFDVVNADNQKAYFTIWYQKADGTLIEGFHRQLLNLMAITGVQNLTPTQATLPKYDHDARKELPTPMYVAQELIGKHFVGLFIAEYQVYNGEKKQKIQLFRQYNQKRQTYQEQLDGQSPKDIDSSKEYMIKRSMELEAKADQQLGYQPDQNNNTSYSRQPDVQPPAFNNQMSGVQPQGNGGGAVDDDIPFMPHFAG